MIKKVFLFSPIQEVALINSALTNKSVVFKDVLGFNNYAIKKTTLTLIILLSFAFAKAQTTNTDLLVTIQRASQVEIDAYNTVDLEVGMLVYNTDVQRIFEYTNSGFLELLTAPNVYTGSFIISGEGTTTITGIPFRASQVTFVANANVESANIDSDNGTGNNDRGIANSFGTMNGFARNNGASIVQQAMYSGAHGNSVNDNSRYASDSNCIGVRYGDQNGSSLGKIEGELTSFTLDGFVITVEYTDGVITVNNGNPLLNIQPDDVNNEALLVLFTAYK